MSRPALKERRVQGLKPSYVRCRAFGHPWEEQPAGNVRAIHGFTELMRCPRCGTGQVAARDWQGQVISRSYDYPEDYQEVTSMTRAEAHVWLARHNRSRATA